VSRLAALFGDSVRPRLLLVGPLPPPIHGQSVAFSMLVDHLLRENEFSVAVMNLTSAVARRQGTASLGRVVELASTLSSALFSLVRARLVYLTISQSAWGFMRDIPIIWAAWVLRKKIVLHMHGGNLDGFFRARGVVYRRIIAATLCRAAVVILLSDKLRTRVGMVPGLAERTVVVPNGVALHSPLGVKRLLPGEEMHVLYLSNLVFEKGYLDVVEAARVLRNRYPEVRAKFHFAGEFLLDRDTYTSVVEMRRDFFRRLREGSLENVVIYHGVVHGEEKERLLEQAHVFVLPTYYRYEGQPLSVLEAMAHGTPIVTTDHAAIGEMVRDGFNGFFVPPRDGQAIAERLSRFHRSPDLVEVMSERNLARVKESFSAESYAGSVAEVFRRCMRA